MSSAHRCSLYRVRRFRPAKSALRVDLRVEELEARCVPTLLGNQIFPVDNPWNQNVSAAPVAANSAAIMNNIVSLSGNGRLHPDFSQDFNTSVDLFGIPYNVVHGNSTPKSSVVIDDFSDESDVVPAPIPANPVLEGDFQNRPQPGVDNRGDSHLIIYDVDANVAYEFYRASRPSENTDGKWHADQESVWDMKTNSFRTIGWTSADAAGLPILAGLVRPDEGLPTSQGGQGVINHAIRFTLQNRIILDQFIYPASHVANPGNTNAAVQPAMGARFRLKASTDLSQLSPQSRIVAQAMKDYGMIVADNGSNFFFSGASYAVNASNQQTLTWDDNDIQDTVHGLKSLHFNDFEVVDLTPVVTDLSVHNGAAGTVVTVTGHNFSGAGGRLQVFFGNAPATSINVLDDGRVAAIVPAGSGSVDVRVQSGITNGADPDNSKSPVFGYGVSALSAGGRFAYGGESKPVPIMATGADAGGGPNVVVFDAATHVIRFSFFAYDPRFIGGVRVATGDVNADGFPDIITCTGPGGGPDIHVYDGVTGQLIRQFFAYDPRFTGGQYVAAGDLNGDKFDDIIIGTDRDGGPNIIAFSGKDQSVLFNFFAYDPRFIGGVRVAAGDVDGDGKADIIGGSGPGGGPNVTVFSGADGSRIRNFFAYDFRFILGIYVAAGDVNGDNKADIITGAGAGGGPNVTVYNGADLTLLESFFPYNPAFIGGVRVAAVGSGNGRSAVLTVAGPSGGADVRQFDGTNAQQLDQFFAYDPRFAGGLFVAGK